MFEINLSLRSAGERAVLGEFEIGFHWIGLQGSNLLCSSAGELSQFFNASVMGGAAVNHRTVSLAHASSRLTQLSVLTALFHQNSLLNS